MPKCPECGAEIDELEGWSLVWEQYIFTVDEDGVGEYNPTGDTFPGDGPDDYRCPECGEILFHDGREAAAFLNRMERMEKNDV
jgi:rubredoxin